jgi:hypothetical protein
MASAMSATSEGGAIMGVETDGLEVWDENDGGWVSAPAEPMVVDGAATEEPAADDAKYNRPHPADRSRFGVLTVRVDDYPAVADDASDGASLVGKFTQQGGATNAPQSVPTAADSRTPKPADRTLTRD